MAKVTLNNVKKVYPNGFEAVRGSDLEIKDGEFVVLVGPSGCGKSTTLRMVAGLEDVSSGTISIGDRVVNDIHPKDRDIAMVFQNYALYPHMTVYANMAFALKLRNMPKQEIDRRVRDTAKTLGIESLLERKPRELSGGQRQRVAVGRAIVREPKAFLFDEPLSNLDAKLRVTTRAELKALHQRLKTTTIYVTHDQEEAMTLGDRIVVMSNGLIQQADTPLNVYRKPANRFVAGFIGTPPMNFLEGVIDKRSDGFAFVASGGDPAIAIPEHRSGRADRFAGMNVVMGIRPTGLREAVGGERPSLSVTVNVVEPLGETMDVSARTASGLPIVARLVARDGVQSGSRMSLVVDANAVHLFESGEFGASITV